MDGLFTLLILLLISILIVPLIFAWRTHDRVKETFLSALKAKDNFKGNSNEKTWLTSILKNKIIDEYRKKGKMETVDGDDYINNFFDNPNEDNAHWSKSQVPKLWDDSMVERMNTKEYYKILHQCIGYLSDKNASILHEKYFEENATEKICKNFNISSSNYWVIIHRINLSLRKCLEMNWIKA